MTVTSTENKQENSLVQEKVDKVEQPKVDANAQQQPIENKVTEDAKEDPNWRAFREARKKDKSEREAAERRAAEKEAEVAALKAAMEAAFAKGNHPVYPQNQSQQEQYQPEETEDERIEKKVRVAMAKAEAEAEKARQEREKLELPQRLMKAYPDYNQVVNEENGAYLEYHYPELYRSLLRQPENFETCSDIYSVVKRFVPNSTTAKKESAKADANFAKPKSISSTGLTQNTESGGSARLTEERKAQNWERMQKMLKGVG